MLTFSTGTKIKGPHRQKIGNALEMSKPLKKSEFGPREGGELITYTPETHGQSSCTKNRNFEKWLWDMLHHYLADAMKKIHTIPFERDF